MADTTYPCFYRFKDSQNQFYWIYYARNGEAISRSSESYVRKEDCDHSVGLMRECADKPYYSLG